MAGHKSSLDIDRIVRAFPSRGWELEDAQRASREGWFLMLPPSDRRGREGIIQARDGKKIFGTDEEATEYVVQRAKDGDAFCQRALKLTIIARMTS